MKVLLTGAFNYSNNQIDLIRSLGFDILFVQDERVEIEIDVSDVSVVVCNSLFLYTPIERFKGLELIQTTSAGLDRLPLEYIDSHNIKLFNARGVYSIPIAEFTICGILQIYKKSYFFHNNKTNHIWEKNRSIIELANKTVLIIGAGSIGTEIAKRLKSFDCKVHGIDLITNEHKYFDSISELSELDNELAIADIVILSLPLTKSNVDFFDKNKFSVMKNNSVFVNISRGQLVNQTDLIVALNQKTIAGAVLDVFDDEPLDSNSPLWDFENVIITPHNSFVGENNNERMFDLIYSNLKGFTDEQ